MSEILPCQIEGLDGSIVSVDVAKRATGEQLLRDVFSHISLDENDYFGLQYFDKKEQLRWLDPLKPIRKQLKNGPYNFRLRVRLYPTSPTYLFDESTRYYISLQIREDLLSKKLLCSEDTKASLYSYLVQGEFGDYDPSEHQHGYLDDFNMLEDESPDFVDKVHILHVQNKGMLPSECDKKFLDLSCRLDRYGMDFHQIVDFSGVRLWVGVTCTGLTVYCGQEPLLTKLNHFPWVRISGVNFKNKQLLLEMTPLPSFSHQEVIGFTCASRSACKELWKSCVCHHSFFRTTRTERMPPAKIGLFRRGSTFRYSGRTQFKLLQDGTTVTRRSSRKFDRLSSRNKIARKTI
ncbi:PREDICTED: protein 4.1-like [Amphimedon queenslandica]|uniref:FERM domain-containing protein n=1 Tax=Amphimedon queenslandica TaxID=400682 RepID=A0A1X7VKS7_AMPQE|nr:PREDICTED: protein 4.1-like [Amphimedon queenslandica]|eukprot:XP_003383890.1 PREDICTED: protein 4.1-like [Amphimedon queenslandica]